MDRLLPMPTDWTENKRKSVCAAARSALHCLHISVRDFKNGTNDALQIAANTLLLLATSTLSDKPNDGELGAILDWRLAHSTRS
jgi:hypothetical protein